MQPTLNAIEKIFKEGAKSPTFSPCVQVLDSTILRSGIRIVISDSTVFTQALLTSARFNSANAKNLENAIVRLTDYMLTNSNENSLLLVADIEILCNPGIVIGKPSKVEFKADAPTQVKNINSLLEMPVGKSPSILRRPQEEDIYAPIRALSITSSDWTIKARVTLKTEIREYNNMRGAGKWFKCILTDKDKSQIQSTFFNAAADRFFDVITQGKVYSFSGGNVKSANPKFSTLDNDIEISFDKGSLITELADDGNIADVVYNFVPLDHLRSCSLNSTVDVCGFLTEIDEVTRLTSRRGEELLKRTLVIMDYTDFSIEVTLWNELASLPELERIDICDNVIISFTNLKVKDFNKLSLSSEKNSTTVRVGLFDHPHVEFLNNWKKEKKQIYPATPLSERKIRDVKFKTTLEIRNEWENSFVSGKTEYFRIIGTLGKLAIEEERLLWYEACTNAPCKKKVTRDSYGKFNCEVCNKNSETCEYRFLTNLVITDCTGTIYATAFDEVMREMLEMSANELFQIFLRDKEAAEKITFNASGRLMDFTVRALPSDNKNGYKFNVKSINKLDLVQITQMMLKELTHI